MTVHADNKIDYWGNIYRANPGLAARGILFEAFLEAPETILSAVAFNLPLRFINDEDYYPLLDQQQAIADAQDQPGMTEEELEQVERDLMKDCDVSVRDGRYMQPLHHHRYAEQEARDRRKLPRG